MVWNEWMNRSFYDLSINVQQWEEAMKNKRASNVNMRREKKIDLEEWKMTVSISNAI